MKGQGTIDEFRKDENNFEAFNRFMSDEMRKGQTERKRISLSEDISTEDYDRDEADNDTKHQTPSAASHKSILLCNKEVQVNFQNTTTKPLNINHGIFEEIKSPFKEAKIKKVNT
jgi:hypothetical protein